MTRARSVETHRVVTERKERRTAKLFAHHSQINESKDEQTFILPYFTFKKHCGLFSLKGISGV